MLAASDTEIWACAQQYAAIVITKDEDFIGLARRGGAVIWLRCGNGSNPALLAWFEQRWPAILQKLSSGERILEVR